MKAKRRIALIALVLILAILAGCGSNTPEAAPGVTAPSASPAPASSEPENTPAQGSGKPEDVIAEIYNGFVQKTLTWEGLWDNYVSDLSKNLGVVTRDEYVTSARSNQEQYNIVYTGYSLVSTEDLGGGIYKVTSVIFCTSNTSDSEVQETVTDYVIDENGAYKYLLSGVVAYDEYANTSDDALRFENIAVYTLTEGIQINFDIANGSAASYSFGWVSGANATLATEEGAYYLTMDAPVKVQAGTSESFFCYFAGAKGALKELTLTNVIELGSNGLPLDASATGIDLTASFE